ncbi:MAG TPA: hypothetical protein P5077_03860 [bacterium]|nr:hypothetical protein [bacterium]
MKRFSLEFHAGLAALFASFSFFLYLFDIPFHYFPHLPFLFTFLCYEKKERVRMVSFLLNGVLFALLAQDIPLFFVAFLFGHLYVFTRLTLEVTTFQFSLVLFLTTFFSSLLVIADVMLYRFVFTGLAGLADGLAAATINLAVLLLLFLFRRRPIVSLYTRDAWL